jgi:hypothetical protein
MRTSEGTNMSRTLTLICAVLVSGAALAGGKPAAKVDLSYAIVGTPRVGQPLEVELRVTPKSQFDEIRLDFGGSERLALDRATPETMALMAQKPGVPALQRVRVVPQADGLHYLKVRVVTFDETGRSRMRGIAIPIGVGKYDARAHLKSNGTLVDGVGGERAVVMRASTPR